MSVLWKLTLALALVALPAMAQMNCSLPNLTGTYAFSAEGTSISTPEEASQPAARPFAEIGMLYFDPSGKVTGWLTGANPQVYDLELVDGILSVQPDCLGTMTARLRFKGTEMFLPSEIKLAFVVKNREPKEIHSLVMQSPLGPQSPVINLATWVRISPLSTPQSPCSLSQMVGTYIAEARATVYVTNADKSVSPVPMAWSMIGYTDTQGKFTGWGPMSAPTALPPMVMGDTSLEVNSDCTGTFKFKFKDPTSGIDFPGQAIEKLIIFRDGDRLTVKALYVQGIMGQPVALETWTRVSQLPMQ